MLVNKKVLNLRGEEIPKTFPTQKELDKLPRVKDRDGKDTDRPNTDKLEKETIGNIIINCLASYIIQDKKEGFYINLIAQSIIDAKGKIELKDKLKKFLIEVLDEMTLRREKVKGKDNKDEEKTKGIYAGWAICKCKEELGIKLDDD